MSVWFLPSVEEAKIHEVGLAGSFQEGMQQAERYEGGPLEWTEPDGICTDGYQAVSAKGVYSVIPNAVRGDEEMIIRKKRRDPRGAKTNQRKNLTFSRRQLRERFEMVWPA